MSLLLKEEEPSAEVIALLPMNKAKAHSPNDIAKTKKNKKNKDGNKCDCEGGDAEGGLVAAGTE